MKPILVTTALVLLLAAAAHAKGASEATIEGPGLDGRVTIPGNGEDGAGTPLGTFAQLAGFFPSVFGQTPSATLPASPATSLGPRYVVRYVVPGAATPAVLLQDIYPYAQPAPVTHMKPGQRVWPGQVTVGGWYLTTTELKTTLAEVGLPVDPPAAGSDSWRPGTVLLELGAAGLLLVAAIGGTIELRRRRRGEPAAA